MDVTSRLRQHGFSALAIFSLGLSGCFEWPGVADRPSGEALFLLTQEFYWVNATGEERIHGDFGLHCAEARYDTATPRVTLVQDRDEQVPEGVLIRAFSRSSFYNSTHVFTMSADMVELVRFQLHNDSVGIRSAFNQDLVLLTLRTVEGTVFLDGEPLAEAANRTVRSSFTSQEENTTFEITEILHIYHMGRAAVYVAPPRGPCL